MDLSQQFKKVDINQFPRFKVKGTEDRFNAFKKQTTVKEFSSITSISISPCQPFDIAVTCSTRCQIYDKSDNSVKRSLTKFSDVTLDCSFRQDGKLVAVSDKSGLVQIFEPLKNMNLRTFKGHQGPAHLVRYLTPTLLFSGADDKVVSLWDIPTQVSLSNFCEHQDFVRAGCVIPMENDLFVTGGYDHKIKLWDKRLQSSAMTLDHGCPVEAVLAYPGKSMLVTAGGQFVKIWDLLSGGNCINVLNNHQKTVTCLAMSKDRLLSGSLDHHVKVFDISSFQAVHSFKYSAPVLSIAVDDVNDRLAVGMTQGFLSIREKSKAKDEIQEPMKHSKPRANTARYFGRGTQGVVPNDVVVVNKPQHKKLATHDRCLKRFQYREALNSALKARDYATFNARVISTKNALSGRDEDELVNVIEFISKFVTYPQYSSTLIAITDLVLELYRNVIGRSNVVDEAITNLRLRIAEEVHFQKKLKELSGVMEMLSCQ